MHDPRSPPLTYRAIAAFWAPLAATWLMMSVEGPFLAAVVARLPDPKVNLAAFGVAFSVALVLEAPVIMLMAATTALVRDAESFTRVRRFSYGLSLGVSVLMVAALVPPVFRWLARDVLALPADVARLTHGALLLLLPWPGVIGYRRFHQGVLIRRHRTRRVGYGTAVRLAGMAASAAALAPVGWPGAWVGSAALSAGVVAEAAAVRWMARGSAREVLRASPAASPPTYRAIARFYAPLALSSMLLLAVHPTITFFLARARAPVESLAVFPVVRGLVFLFSCLGLSYQEVGIALLGDRGEGFRPLARFAAGLAGLTSVGLAVVAFTPLCDVWFRTISGLSPELARFARLPARILVVVPALTVALSFLRALFVRAGTTGPIIAATAADVLTLAAGLALGIGPAGWVGAVAGAAALDAGRMVSLAFLGTSAWRRLRGVPVPAR